MGLYDRQEKLELNTPEKITVIGCGGIGYWVGKFLAMSGCEHIELYDPDTLEEHNRNRLDIPMRFLGKNKADITKQAIISIREDCTVMSFPFKYDEMTANKTDWVIDCTDDGDSQIKNEGIAARLGSRYFKAGYDGEGFGIHNSIPDWGDSTDGYTIVPSWVVPAVIVAALAVAKVMKYPEKEVISSIDKLFRFDR